jgi:hypothetical protein
MKTEGGMEINRHAFSITMVNGVSDQLGAQATLTLGKDWTKGWAGPRAGLDVTAPVTAGLNIAHCIYRQI